MGADAAGDRRPAKEDELLDEDELDEDGEPLVDGLSRRRAALAHKYRRNGNVSHSLHAEFIRRHRPRSRYRCASTSFDVDVYLKDDEDARMMFEGHVRADGEDRDGPKVDKATSYHSATVLLKWGEAFRVLKGHFARESSVFVVRGVFWKVFTYVLLSIVFFYFSMSVQPGSVVMSDIRSIRNSLNTGVTFLLTAYITRCLNRWYSIVLVRRRRSGGRCAYAPATLDPRRRRRYGGCKGDPPPLHLRIVDTSIDQSLGNSRGAPRPALTGGARAAGPSTRRATSGRCSQISTKS